MKILLLNEWFNPLIQNLIHYFSSSLGPNEFHWTGKRWYRNDFLPFTELEEVSKKPESECLTDLQNGKYNFVIFSDASSHIFTSSHFSLKGTKRIIIDGTDIPVIPRYYYENSEIYFKAQLSLNEITIKNQNETNTKSCNYSELKNIYPICLSTSFKTDKIIPAKVNGKHYDVFFNGSAWPKERIKIINKIKNIKEINFFGGLYNREDLNFNNVIPDYIRYRKLGFQEYINSVEGSKICLNIRGNGVNCFRQFEIMYLGGFLLTQEFPFFFGQVQPEHKKHCVYFKEDLSNLEELILYYLTHDEERNEIAKNGKEFFENNFHPRSIVNYILEIMKKYE